MSTQSPQRILIIGAPGAGKSTLAAHLGKKTSLPVIHLDQQFWQPGWQETPDRQWRDRVRQLTDGERWIIDGSYTGTLDLRLPRAELVIHLDLPRRVYMQRIIRRIVSSYGRVRPDMADGCPERFDWIFLKWAWNYPRRHAQLNRDLLATAASHATVIHIRTPQELNRLYE